MTTLITFLLKHFGGKYSKVVGVVLLVLVSAGGVKYHDHKIYKRAMAEFESQALKDYNIALESSVRSLKEEQAQALTLERGKTSIANKALIELRSKPTLVEVREIEKIIEAGPCRALSIEYVRLLNSH